MINLTSTLNHMNIPLGSVNRAIQLVRGRLERAPSETVGASTFIKSLLDVDVKFTNSNKARIASFAIVQEVFRLNGMVDNVDNVVQVGLLKAEEFVNEPTNAWIFANASTAADEKNDTQAIIDGVATKVTVNSNGTIKRGGAKVLALELYRREAGTASDGIVNSGLFTKLLVKELGMSVEGARTYAYNAKKSFLAEQV